MLLHEKLEFTIDDIRALILQAIRTSWLPDTRQRELSESFLRDADWSISAGS